NNSMVSIISCIVDLLIVWYVLYLLITVMNGTKAIQLIKGIFFILIGRVISNFFDLATTTQMFDTVLEWGFLAIIVIFQPELRRALEQLGRGSLFRTSGTASRSEHDKMRGAMVECTRSS